MVRDLPQRDTTQTRIGTRTSLERGAHRFDAGLSLAKTEDAFTFPIAHGVRVTKGWDANLMGRYAYSPEGADLPLIEATLNHAFGQADRDYYYNAAGARGAQFGENRLKASTTTAHLGANLPLGGAFLIAPSLSYTHATRENTELWAARAGTAADTGHDRTYSGRSPALALRWTPAQDQTAWISLARSFDAPTSDDLLSPVGGTVNSNPTGLRATDVAAQRARTLEIGWRGSRGAFGWDAVAYHSQIENELLQLNTSSGVPYVSNADRTVHDGLELGLTARFRPDLRGRLAWTWQDFHFDDDATRGDNSLAGAPRNLIKARLDWQASERLALTGSVTWRDEIWVDNANTAKADAVTLLDLGASYALNDRVTLVADLTNLTDEHYAAAIVAADTALANGASYLPGEGRAAYVGVKMAF
ncbi:TonB-dependent receptor domain-containing protein [Rhodobacter capsulatus]|uniref:TonB-dependent receptor domain-containing protein n=1 Tax=Rhodobacter capsulatus TaxID=1061 RepID=UPI004025ECAF